MQCLVVSCAVRRIYMSLGAKGLTEGDDKAYKSEKYIKACLAFRRALEL